MDASDEFRFINTSTATNSSSNGVSSSAKKSRRTENEDDDGSHEIASASNSLRTVPVRVYNENRSFKGFFWDKAFKLFHSHRPVYRAISGINYQDCGTIGSCNTATLENTSSSHHYREGLVKVRSQSHNQLNRIVAAPGSNNDTDIFCRGNKHRALGPTASATTSRIVATITSGSSSALRRAKASNNANAVFMNGQDAYNNSTSSNISKAVNGHGASSPSSPVSSSIELHHVPIRTEEQEFIPVVVPRKKNRAFGFNSGEGCGNNGSSSSSISRSKNFANESVANNSSTITGKKVGNKWQNSQQCFLVAKRPVISGGEKPQGGDGSNNNNDESCIFSYYEPNNHHHHQSHQNLDYDNIASIHVNNENRDKSSEGKFLVAEEAPAGTSSHIIFPHSTKHAKRAAHNNSKSHVILPPHRHHSSVSATLSTISFSAEAAASASTPVLRRTQSTKSHSSNGPQQQLNCNFRDKRNRRSSSSNRNVPSPTCSSYETWKSSATGFPQPYECERVENSGSACCEVDTRCSCHSAHFYESSDDTRRGCCDYCNCEGSCQEDDEVNRRSLEDSDTIGNDSGLDTWKKSSSANTNESPRSGSSNSNSDEGPSLKSSCSTGGGEEAGIVCTISQKIPSNHNKALLKQRQKKEEEEDSDEGDYATVASEGEEENSVGMSGRCGKNISGGTVIGNGFCAGTDEFEDKSMMIENGSVMYDSLDDTYSVPSVNGNTTVVLINGCCESDHCQNTTLSDTFNFSDYDVECMSEIDLNSEPGSGSGSVVESSSTGNYLHHIHSNSCGQGESSGDIKLICHSTSENELDSLDLTMFETRRSGESIIKMVNSANSNNNYSSNNSSGCNGNHSCRNDKAYKDDTDRSLSLCAETGGIAAMSTETTMPSSSPSGQTIAGSSGTTEGDGCSQLLLFVQKYGTNKSTASSTTTTTTSTLSSSQSKRIGDQGEEIYSNWSDAGSEFEFLGPTTAAGLACTGLNRDIPMGHSPRGNPPEVEWEPYFCVLNQLDQTFTSYRSEEMSFGDNGISPTEIPRIRLDGGPNSIKCLINNAKWGMNPLMEEEEDPNHATNNGGNNDKGDYSSSSGSSNNPRTNSSPNSPLDTSYDKACGSERRGSAPLTPLLGRETPSRFANFFSKRSFKSNPLKRTKSVTKLERKKASGVIEPESGGNMLYPSRMRISRSHESLLAWTNNPVNNFVSNGMMSTMDLTAGDVSIRPLHPSILGQEYAFQVTTPTGSKYYTCSSAAERDSWVYAFRQAIRPRADEVRRRENALKIWILEGKGIPGGSSGKHSSKRYFCELYLDDVLYARTCGKPRGDMLFWGEHFEFTQLPNCVQLITVVFFREGDKKRKKERNTCIGKVKIPVNSVTSRYLIEKWYPVLPDTSSQSSKEKEHPSLRIKCKYQSVDILPIRCYKPFLQYVKDQYGPLSECLESVLSVKAKEDLASAMVHVLHHEGLAKEFIAELALQEILKSGDEKLTFRGNSIATKAMEGFLKLTGTEYLHASLGPVIEQFQCSEDLYDCEIDPMKLPMGANLAKNQQNLRMAVDTVWKAIMHSHTIFPMELRECFSHCREALKSAGKEELSDHLISASIFLRFLCPAILSPSLFNITNEYPSEKSARNLTLIAKVLQTLANFTRFQGKENYMEFINDFVEREASNMKAFLSCISSPLNPDAIKKAQKESRDKVPAGGFIDLGKFLSILSTLLSENVAKIAPKNDRFKHLQELLETIHKWLEQPANATNVSMFPFPHLPSPPPSGPPPPAPALGIPMNHRFSNPLCNNNSQAINHQYQIPHHIVNATTTPIYAVTNVIHNNSNPNVKNISQVPMNMSGSCMTGNSVPPFPLQLQIPHVNPNQIGINNQRSGSQASSGYQSQSPVEGDDKGNKKSSNIKEQINAHINNINMRATEMQDATTALTFNNPVFNRKTGSQSVDDLSTIGVEKGDETPYPRRLARSSSSSDCEYTHSNISPTKGRARGQPKLYSTNANAAGQQSSVHSKSQGKSGHHRLSRRSSAELLRKNHPYSSSSDEDSDSGLVNERDEPTPHLPPRRNHIKRNSGHRPVPDGSSNGEKSLEEYEREMSELRRAMEALQVKLSRAEERLFGNESPSQNKRNENVASPANSNGSGNGSKDKYPRSLDDGSKEMDQLLQRLLSAEEEMKREHDLLTALDKKQKLIEAQEQKIARLDAVNNQLLQALAQIRDSLQQQHVQQQQQKIQQQLLKQQQHLKNLANGFVPPCSNQTGHQSSSVTSQNSLNNNGSSLGSRPSRPNQLQFTQSPAVHRDSMNPSIKNNNNNCNANTTKVLITSSSSESLSQATGDSNSDTTSNNRDSSAILGEQALKMLAELRSSSC